MHTLPQLFMLLEWRHSSIPISWERFPLYLLITTIYTLVNVSMGEKGINLYSSIEWTRGVSLSTTGVLIGLTTYAFGFWFAKYITDNKLRSNGFVSSAHTLTEVSVQ